MKLRPFKKENWIVEQEGNKERSKKEKKIEIKRQL